MKLANQTFFSFGNKRWSTIILFIVLPFLTSSASVAQNISVQVNYYLKAQVKETTLKGTMLVAENMTDWFSQTNSAPSITKKSVKQTAAKTVVSAVKSKKIAKCP